MRIAVSTKKGTAIVKVLQNPVNLYAVLEAAGVQDMDFDAVEVDGLRIGGFSNDDPEKRELRLKTFCVRCTNELSSVRLLKKAAA